MVLWSLALLFLLSIAYLSRRYSKAMVSIFQEWMRPVWPHESKHEETRAGETKREPESHSTPQIHVDGDGTTEDTPKAAPTEPAESVPNLALDDNDSLEHTTKHANLATPALPFSPSVQTVSEMPPPPRPTARSAQNLERKNAPSTVPRDSTAPRQAQSSAVSSLRIPRTGPVPDRGPPSTSQQRVSGSLSVNGGTSAVNTRGKVLLAPGHSPMDWAALAKSRDLSGVSTFQRVTPSLLKTKTGRKGKPAWSSWQGKVYNITPYIPFHPGGEAEILKAAGRDGTKLFLDIHPWVNWENMLGTCLVGVVVPEDFENGESSLEAMD